MKNKIGKHFQVRKRFLLGVLLLLLALIMVGVLLANKMNGILDSYVEDMLREQATAMAELENEYFESEYRQLTEISCLLENVVEDQEKLEALAAELFEARTEQGVEKGVLALDGKAVVGEPLSFADYPCIRMAFHGHNTTGFMREQGMVFCRPVYRAGNVKYVIYYRYTPEETQKRFSTNAYQGKTKVLVADKNDAVVIRSGEALVDEQLMAYLESNGDMKALREKLNIATAAAVAGSWQGRKSMFFIAEIGNTDMYLLGQIYSTDVAGDVEALMHLLIWVFGLLVVLMVSGMIFLVSVEERAMESVALREAKEEAERANAAKSDFLSSMSHEIRTPINAVLGMTEMILRESKEDQILDYASSIDSAGNALLSLINDVLDISRIESGKMEITESEYELFSLVNDSYHMVISRADAKNLPLNVSCQEDLPSKLYGDMVHIRQILVNFLTNAIKYTKEGHVDFRISGERKEEGQIALVFEVADTGIGMTPESVGKLFNKFERFDMKKNQTIEGTGLGLAITKQLSELLGGEIEVESEYEKGSVFRIRLNQAIKDEKPVGRMQIGFNGRQAKEKQEKEHFRAPGKRILVVDDVEMNLKVFGFLLKTSEMEIDTALSGKACLELVQQKQYDMIFMDHMMPEMDGIETLRKMKELKENRNQGVPVIMLTANATSGVREEYLAEGFTDYLSKPVRSEQLESILEEHLMK